MTQIQSLGLNMSTASLIACNHCGIVALDTPAFGWRRWREPESDDTDNPDAPPVSYSHHCAAAVEQNSWIAQNLVHMMAPDEAIVYEDPEVWIAELLGAIPAGTQGPQDD